MSYLHIYYSYFHVQLYMLLYTHFECLNNLTYISGIEFDMRAYVSCLCHVCALCSIYTFTIEEFLSCIAFAASRRKAGK